MRIQSEFNGAGDRVGVMALEKVKSFDILLGFEVEKQQLIHFVWLTGFKSKNLNSG